MNLAERMKIVPVLVTANINSSCDTDSINMANYQKATFVFTCGACGGAVTVSFNSGVTEGTKTNAVAYRYAIGGAAIGTAVAGSTASCDVLGATTAVATTAALTVSTCMFICEFNASAITTGDNWVTGTLACATGIVHGVAYLVPRFSGYRSVTCLK